MAKAAPMLSLQHFMLQSTLIHAYRSAVRATRPIPDTATRRETLDFFRSDLERLQFVSDTAVLKQHISAFKRLVKQMIPSIGLGGLTSDTGAKSYRDIDFAQELLDLRGYPRTRQKLEPRDRAAELA